jgi:hypothetical protein
MEKVDLRKQLTPLWSPPRDPILVDVPAFNFAMIDGEGDPNGSSAFQDAVQALYALTYGAKFLRREEETVDFKVMPLEGL